MSGEVFGTGGGEQAARSMDVPFLGRVDLDPAVRAAGDAGQPVLLSDPQSASAQALRSIASNLAAQISILRYEQEQRGE